jgi:CheY-like chemotaxis protein
MDGYSSGRMEPRRILLVEDDAAIRETIAELLEEEGYRVASAANGAEALELLSAPELPSVILLDLMMPVMSGWELHEALQDDPRLASIPVVVISASRSTERLAPIEAAAFLAKPFDATRLLDTVGRLV